MKSETSEPAEAEIRRILSDVYLPNGVDVVMRSRNTMLGMRSPDDLLRCGEFDRLAQWAHQLADGNF